MDSISTVGRDIYKGVGFAIRTANCPDVLEDASGKDIYQISLITEGTIILCDGEAKTALLPPQLVCISYANPMKRLEIQHARGFSVFFLPRVINFALFNSQSGQFQSPETRKTSQEDAFLAEKLLIKPFKHGEISNPFHIALHPALLDRFTDMYKGLHDQFTLQPNEFWPCRGRSYFLEMLMLLQNLYAFEGNSALDLPLPRGDALIEQAIKDMLLAYSEPNFRSGSIRGTLGPFAFYRRFRKATGLSPALYLRYLRMTVAASLMRNTMLPPGDIAARCGYGRQSRFDRDFRRQYGKSAEEYRAEFPNPYG